MYVTRYSDICSLLFLKLFLVRYDLGNVENVPSRFFEKKILKNKFQNSDEKIKSFFGIKNLNNDISFYWPVGIFNLKKIKQD